MSRVASVPYPLLIFSGLWIAIPNSACLLWLEMSNRLAVPKNSWVFLSSITSTILPSLWVSWVVAFSNHSFSARSDIGSVEPRNLRISYVFQYFIILSRSLISIALRRTCSPQYIFYPPNRPQINLCYNPVTRSGFNVKSPVLHWPLHTSYWG